MQCSTAKAAINQTATTVRDASYKDKQELTHEQAVDLLLDSILEFKKFLREKIESVNTHIEKLEQITWFDVSMFDDETKRKVNDVISSTNDWFESLNKWYQRALVNINSRVQPSELEEFGSAIYDLKDANNDLEKAVFVYPNDEEMTAITEKFKNLVDKDFKAADKDLKTNSK